ncbi:MULTISPECIES: flagellar hook-basal body complex protein [unclassified Pseudomonas]|uniref:flagellar hook-basal body protein n=1 Tax=unclassified Pseudomonas TaxID=196821 RepID=UPI0024492DC8|nr:MULTISPECIES: flagellar hook-basal body complex protein [unclassified Pseudomonas]MDG9930377.1 flagellar hook-basal body complex protein [Pseudomonas sp. GD04042]MDH0484510.1 flagellar hook-basal body complex protein [Pseudomonas sp. GD04015]MDH0606032.1 flagellar hook-basal body complex protein [Pseudomonas sp. GD03869]
MTDLIMQLAGVIQRDIDGLTDVSHNVANANSVGYKSSRAFNVFSPLLPVDGMRQGLDAVQARSYVDPAGGALQTTGRVTDLALAGDAWFVLQTPDGAMLTRDGRFRVDAAGYLVGDQGYPLMGDDGPIQVRGGELVIDGAGVVRVDGREAGRISVMRVHAPHSVEPMGNGLYISHSPLLPAKDFVLHQGMQERSNAALGNDMVRMMEATRHVESMQRALSAYDGMLDSGINQLGKD